MASARTAVTGTKPIETEIKLKVENLVKTRRMLRHAGYHVSTPRVFEQNLVLDDAKSTLRTSGMLLRVRSAGSIVTCTLKKKELAGRHKSREEREFQSSSLVETLAVFEGLGYREAFRYEKYRTEFARNGERGHVTLDETPMGEFMELEGKGPWIDRTAKAFGFTLADYITDSYAVLWEKWCAEHGLGPRDMRFQPRQKR
jgi:adenylate cyclase class 2